MSRYEVYTREVYTHSSFETFPFPDVGASLATPVVQINGIEDGRRQAAPLHEAIAQAARELVQKRDAWLAGADAADKKPRTLTRLYNERPTWLDLAHRKLDDAVFAAYGWDPGLSDDAILERLLALNLERAE